MIKTGDDELQNIMLNKNKLSKHVCRNELFWQLILHRLTPALK